MKVQLNASDLVSLYELAIKNNKVEEWAELVMEWLTKFDKAEKEADTYE